MVHVHRANIVHTAGSAQNSFDPAREYLLRCMGGKNSVYLAVEETTAPDVAGSNLLLPRSGGTRVQKSQPCTSMGYPDLSSANCPSYRGDSSLMGPNPEKMSPIGLDLKSRIKGLVSRHSLFF